MKPCGPSEHSYFMVFHGISTNLAGLNQLFIPMLVISTLQKHRVFFASSSFAPPAVCWSKDATGPGLTKAGMIILRIFSNIFMGICS